MVYSILDSHSPSVSKEQAVGVEIPAATLETVKGFPYTTLNCEPGITPYFQTETYIKFIHPYTRILLYI